MTRHSSVTKLSAQKAKNAERRTDVEEVSKFYREAWMKLMGRRFDKLIADNAAKFGGLLASRIALAKSRMLLDFLSRTPKLFAE